MKKEQTQTKNKIKKIVDQFIFDDSKEQIKKINDFFLLTKHKRTYTAQDIVKLRGSFIDNIPTQSIITAEKMRQKLASYKLKGKAHFRSLGALNPTQARAMVEATLYTNLNPLDGIYISGWQEASSGENTYGNMFPDQSIYPSNSVPEKIRKINNVLQSAEKIKQEELHDQSTDKKIKTEMKNCDYQVPIIADLETGFGLENQTFQMTLECIRSGVACVHLEDQDGALKKCGHMGGKVKIPLNQFINKLRSIRLAADVAGSDIVIIGRTDAKGTKLINSIADQRDLKFCYKQLSKTAFSNSTILKALEINTTKLWKLLIDQSLINKIKINTHSFDVIDQKLMIKLEEAKTDDKCHTQVVKQIEKNCNLSNIQAIAVTNLLQSANFLKTKDGYYRYNASIDACIDVAIEIAPYVDLIWFETAEPCIEEAKTFAKAVHKVYPNQAFHYNCSPSFNWSAHFKKKYGKEWKEKLISFNHELATYGFKSQKITLFGMHTINDAMKTRVIDFQLNNMGGYSHLQDNEKQTKNRSFEHQSFVGANVWASITSLCSNEANELLATFGESATMNQFKNK